MDSFFDAPGPDHEIVASARALQPLIREHASDGDANRRASDTVMDILHAQGLLHIAVPKRLGGKGANFRTFIDAVAEIGYADGGTAWASALLNVCTWFATLFSEQAQADVFGGGKLSRVCGIFTPPQISERIYDKVSGGVRVTGEWPYASGSAHADWAVLGVKVGENADGSPILGLGLIPMADLSLKDSWFVAGMRASASNTLVANNVFVPDHRIQLFERMGDEDYLREASDEASDYASFIPVAALVLCGAQLGLVRAALDLSREKGAAKNVAYTIYAQARQSPAHQIAIAQAASEADQAYLLLARAAADIDKAASRREKLDRLTRARIRMDTGQTARLCRTAINRLLSFNGASSFADVNPIQRIWRDSEIAGRHAFVMPEIADLIYGRILLGLEEPVQPF
ncbi:hypothetical protein WP12_06805 [Sphingomonas sp. SRS2]|nr:hypothetical protein WP12_06805 [Sphingomonas sp. SRS2]